MDKELVLEEIAFINLKSEELHHDKKDPLRIAKDVFAGTMGGVAQVLVGQPFDTAKVRLQSDALGKYTGMLDVSKTLVQHEGLSAFYKGTMAPLMGVGVCVSIQFAVNEYMKRMVFQNKEDLSSLQYWTAGTAAGFANSVVASPIEHIRSRLQMQVSGNMGSVQLIREIYQKAGLRGIMRGYIPTLMRGLGTGIYFMTFEKLVAHDMRTHSLQRKEIPGWRMCLYGGLAGNCMWAASYPIDFVKTKLQTDSLDTPKYRGMKDVVVAVYKARGIAGFFKGFVPTMLRAAPANAATFYAFELTIRALG
jgi:solute carrier family 25 carnitine/acylcarnitine transporter 20/29